MKTHCPFTEQQRKLDLDSDQNDILNLLSALTMEAVIMLSEHGKCKRYLNCPRENCRLVDGVQNFNFCADFCAFWPPSM